jgi:hypothetical protein
MVSPVVALTVAVSVSILPFLAVTLTTIVTVGVVVAATWPRVQVTVGADSEQLPWLTLADLNV